MAVCLELTSLSSLALEQTDDSYDLVFDLSSKSLPLFSAVECWRGRSISPLRDRVMIEWLFSHYEAHLLLDSMLSTISEAVKKEFESSALPSSLSTSNEEGSTSLNVKTLQVAVTCQNGAQHSVCFVEKLYEKCLLDSPLELEGGVKVDVKRRHIEATRGEWLSTKNAVWQHSRFPVKHLVNHSRDLVTNQVWSNFPLESAQQIEAGFLKDPFATDLDVGKHIINFERGVLLNKRSQEEFKIRSTVPSMEGKVQSSWLDDVEYRAFHKSYCSAGILFYSVHPQTGEAVFLLGHMTYGCMSWCDFGGLKGFRERAKYTAARECYEETLGILGKTKQLVSMLEDYEMNNVFKIVNRDTRYVGHFLRVPYKDYPAAFDEALATALDRQVEVNDIRWFSLSCLRNGIQKALLDQYDIKVQPLNEDGTIEFSHEPAALRLELVHSLCIADHLGILESIEHIASEHHERNRPPPPPHVSLPQPRQHSTHSRSEPSENKISLDRETSFPVHVHPSSSTNHIPDIQTDNKEPKDELYSEGVENTLAKNELLIRSEVGRNESTDYSFMEARNIKSSLCNDEGMHFEQELSPLQQSKSESCNAVTDINITSSSIERDGPKKGKENPNEMQESFNSSPSSAGRGSNCENTSDSCSSLDKKFVYYGIGGGTFLY